MKSNKAGIFALAVGAFMALGSASQAASCSVNGVTFSLEVSSASSCVAGNDLGANGIIANDLSFFGLTGWGIGDSTDPAEGDGAVAFVSAPQVGASSGDWSLQSYNGYSPLMIVLKAGRGFGAFLLTEMVSGLSGKWSITKDNNDDDKELSHASVYYNGEPTPSAVPLPAAGFLMLGGLAGLAALRRTRKSA